MKPRSTRRGAAPPPHVVIGAARTERARPVRFRLSVHSPRDQAIARWLEGIPRYARAEAIRCALYDHLHGGTVRSSTDTLSQPVPSSIPPDPSSSAAQEHVAATKLRRMF
jgi:diadenosine tetraphosphatase ApaH/serine/threonine PP2A family protein phosphatase